MRRRYAKTTPFYLRGLSMRGCGDRGTPAVRRERLHLPYHQTDLPPAQSLPSWLERPAGPVAQGSLPVCSRQIKHAPLTVTPSLSASWASSSPLDRAHQHDVFAASFPWPSITLQRPPHFSAPLSFKVPLRAAHTVFSPRPHHLGFVPTFYWKWTCQGGKDLLAKPSGQLSVSI